MKFARIFNIGYMPRWLIVCMDIFLSFFAIILSYLLRFNFQIQRVNKDPFTRAIFVTLSVYLICFFIFRSFKEIIRHTTFDGVLKIFFAVLTANLFLITLNSVFSSRVLLVPYSVLGINFFISFVMLAASRMIIKKIFEAALRIKKEPVVIFGAGTIGQAASKNISYNNTLEGDAPDRKTHAPL